MRKLETLSDERGYQVLDFVEYLESKYAERARVEIDDIMSAARSQYGIGELAEVRHAVLETDGKISIIARQKG